MAYQFGAWAPDVAGVNNGVLVEARNVLPNVAGYMPIPGLSAYSSNALAEKCLGAISVKTSAGGWVVFVGTATKLYREVNGVLTDYTRLAGGAYSATDSDKWSFANFGQYVIAVNPNDDAQVIDVDAGTANFSALGGSPPRARYVFAIKDFLCLAGLTSDPRAVRNSDINAPTTWTVGTGLCDEQTLPSGGRITGAVGGEFGYILSERAIRRMTFQPGLAPAFSIEVIDENKGCASGYGVVAVGASCFFPSDNGFYQVVGNQVIPIGANYVNEWFDTNSDGSRVFEVQGFLHPHDPIVGWAFYSSDTDTNYTRLLFYNWAPEVTARWSYAITEVQYITNHATSGTTLEGLDAYMPSGIDVATTSFDSRIWEGGRPALLAFDADGYLSFFDGAVPLTAIIQTNTIQVNPGYRSKNFTIRPIGELLGAGLTLRVGKREHTGDLFTYTGVITAGESSGAFRCRASGAYHTVELTLDPGFAYLLDTDGAVLLDTDGSPMVDDDSDGLRWTLIQGLDIQATTDGRK